MSAIQKLHDAGQSPWQDDIVWSLQNSGTLFHCVSSQPGGTRG
jgi:hypothetical protein